MTHPSILFVQGRGHKEEETLTPPTFFADFNLDQIIDAVTAGRQEYNLKPFFYAPLRDIDAIRYRQEIFRDLEDEDLLKSIKSFSQRMYAMRDHLRRAERLSYKYQKERWFLEAVEMYCHAVQSLADDFSRADFTARGFLNFREYLKDYTGSSRFATLVQETKKQLDDLASVTYCLLLKNGTIKVRKYESEMDYSARVEETFKKFKQGDAQDYRMQFPDGPEMNHVEAAVLELVARLYPNIFSSLESFFRRHLDYRDEVIGVFDREIQFYIAYLEFIAVFKRVGLRFCFPEMVSGSKEIKNTEGFDLALAHRLIQEKSSIVCNDFYLQGKERILVISGPNQGGKTTFARTFGQLHFLASIGCPVPGGEARLFLFDRLFSHFEREENIQNLCGKLQDDLIRIHEILQQATSNSIIVLNEIFTSTTLQDAVFLSRKVMEKIAALDLLAVWVTFIDELSSFSEQTVSMVSTVGPENPTLRTYKLMRKPADGLSYAIAIAEKYRLTHGAIKERIGS